MPKHCRSRSKSRTKSRRVRRRLTPWLRLVKKYHGDMKAARRVYKGLARSRSRSKSKSRSRSRSKSGSKSRRRRSHCVERTRKSCRRTSGCVWSKKGKGQASGHCGLKSRRRRRTRGSRRRSGSGRRRYRLRLL